MKQPHEMTYTELNRAMIWLYIEKLPPYVKDCFIEDNGGVLQIDLVECMWDVDFLSDWNLMMPLAVKSNIGCNFSSKESYVEHRLTYNTYSYSDNPLRAICEVLVSIAMEKVK